MRSTRATTSGLLDAAMASRRPDQRGAIALSASTSRSSRLRWSSVDDGNRTTGSSLREESVPLRRTARCGRRCGPPWPRGRTPTRARRPRRGSPRPASMARRTTAGTAGVGSVDRRARAPRDALDVHEASRFLCQPARDTVEVKEPVHHVWLEASEVAGRGRQIGHRSIEPKSPATELSRSQHLQPRPRGGDLRAGFPAGRHGQHSVAAPARYSTRSANSRSPPRCTSGQHQGCVSAILTTRKGPRRQAHRAGRASTGSSCAARPRRRGARTARGAAR